MNRLYLSYLLFLLPLLGLSQGASSIVEIMLPAATAQASHYPSKLDSVQDLREIVVTYQANKTTPVTFQNVPQSQISLRPPSQEPSYLLAETPSITNYSDAGSSQGYSYFRLRGVDQTRVNITLDGMPLNEPEDQGAYLANYPDLLNSLSKIQIQRGVGTTKNGAASYVGSIELYSPNLGDPQYTSATIGYGSFQAMGATVEHSTGIHNNKALYVRASRTYTDGYKYHSSNDSKSLFISTGLQQEKTSWKFNAHLGQHSNGQAWLGVSDSLLTLDRRTNGNSEEEDDSFTQGLAQLQHKWFPTAKSSLQSSIYYSHLNGNYNFDLGNYLGYPDLNELYNYAFVSHMVGLYSNYTYELSNAKLVAGMHANLYQRQHKGSEQSLGILYTNTGYKDEISTFIKAESTVGNLLAFLDVQVRYVTFTYQGSANLPTLDWSFLNPKAGLSWIFDSKSLLYYSIGQTGREPTRNDMFGGNDDLPADSLGNGILTMKDPEQVLDQELGYRYQNNKGSIGFNLYYMSFENEIVLDGKFGPNGLALTNAVDKSYRTGVELSATWKTGVWSFSNNSSYNYSKIKDQEITFTPILTPKWIVNQEATYTQDKWEASLLIRYQDDSFINYSNTSSIADFCVVNLRASYQIIPKLTLTGYLNNVTNTHYNTSGYEDWDGTNKYFVQAPFNYYVSLKYSL